jgi:hypothetical protein
MASQLPLKGPCFFNAVNAYSEQVGLYLQLAGVNGEMQCM